MAGLSIVLGRSRMRRLGLIGGMLLAVAVAPTVVWSHHLAGDAGGDGIPVPSLAHGQMEVYARHWGEIISLAARAPSPSGRGSRVLNFARIQKAWCLWGLAPGAVADEESPFNECSHAYLAAARTLLDALRERSPRDPAVDDLAALVDRDLVLAGAPVICGFSGEDFNTARHVVPRWSGVVGHPASLGLFASAGLLLFGLAAAGRRWLIAK